MYTTLEQRTTSSDRYCARRTAPSRQLWDLCIHVREAMKPTLATCSSDFAEAGAEDRKVELRREKTCLDRSYTEKKSRPELENGE